MSDTDNNAAILRDTVNELNAQTLNQATMAITLDNVSADVKATHKTVYGSNGGSDGLTVRLALLEQKFNDQQNNSKDKFRNTWMIVGIILSGLLGLAGIVLKLM